MKTITYQENATKNIDTIRGGDKTYAKLVM
ncbi:hypothetical protein HMPREF1532_02993 [Bacteroides salyersiae WAL 10018 = DSM 18765 = JCM 12988]|nr:hypothetical protein HMPREF1532_02993 [Bacteroides salyersiae WAL 10018 = DSM 18765 = JCM 12988]